MKYEQTVDRRPRLHAAQQCPSGLSYSELFTVNKNLCTYVEQEARCVGQGPGSSSVL